MNIGVAFAPLVGAEILWAVIAAACLFALLLFVSRSRGATVRTLREWAVTGHPSTARSLEFSADGRHLLSGRDDGSVRRWDLTRGPGGIFLNGRRRCPRGMSFAVDVENARAAPPLG